MAEYSTILVHKEGSTAIITINRAQKLNSLNKNTLSELSTVLDKLLNDHRVRGIILTGAGDKAFAAGADIQEFLDMTGQDAKLLVTAGQQNVMDKIESYPKPVIAAINGFALGGGLELALAAHMRIATSKSKMGLPEVSLGLIPGYGGTQRLPQLVGKGRAFEMIMTGDMIGAQEALANGLINYVVEEDELIPKCLALLERIYLRSPKAIEAAVIAINTGVLEPESGFQKEKSLFAACFDTAEAKEGIQAFLEKRKPNF